MHDDDGNDDDGDDDDDPVARSGIILCFTLGQLRAASFGQLRSWHPWVKKTTSGISSLKHELMKKPKNVVSQVTASWVIYTIDWTG